MRLAARRFGFGLAGLFLASAALAAPEGHESSALPAITPKPTAPIAIDHRFDGEPAIGQPLELVVIVTAQAELADVVAELSTSDGLELLAPLEAVRHGDLARGASFEIAVTVLPLVNERLNLNVAVGALVGGAFQGRALAIRIPLPGATSADAAGVEHKFDEDGEPLSAFPAQETVD